MIIGLGAPRPSPLHRCGATAICAGSIFRRGEGGPERDGLTSSLGQVPDVGDTPGVTPAMVLACLFRAVTVWFPPAPLLVQDECMAAGSLRGLWNG